MKHISSFTPLEVQKIFKNAQKKVHTLGLRILISPTGNSYGRILVITPRRSGNAPQRNRIRRRLKAIFVTEKLYENKYDYIVLVHNQAIHTPFEKLKKLLLQAYS